MQALTQPRDPDTGKLLPPLETRFQPGQSGNPGGRVKGSWSVRKALQRKLAAHFECDPDQLGRSAIDLADLAIQAALGQTELSKGQREMLAWAVENAEGKLSQHHQVDGAVPVKRVILEPRGGPVAEEPPSA